LEADLRQAILTATPNGRIRIFQKVFVAMHLEDDSAIFAQRAIPVLESLYAAEQPPLSDRISDLLDQLKVGKGPPSRPR
jgi:hypothetical protein